MPANFHIIWVTFSSGDSQHLLTPFTPKVLVTTLSSIREANKTNYPKNSLPRILGLILLDCTRQNLLNSRLVSK